MSHPAAEGPSARAAFAPRADRRPWPDHRAVWRWHFYAGLFCLPFVCWLAVTGSVYLWRPQVEAWLDRPYDRLVPGVAAAPARFQVEAALDRHPEAVLRGYELPRTPNSSARVLLGQGEQVQRVYVDPYTLEVLKSVREDDRLMSVVFRLHGELLLGDRGSYLVELAASWAVIMILTGLYLWWPRKVTGLGGVLYPRLGAGSRLFWRDLHAVTGLWVAGFALVLLASGLPWAAGWGWYLKEARQLSGAAIARQDWSAGRKAELAERAALNAGTLAAAAATGAAADEHAGHHHGAAGAGPPAPYAALDRMVPVAAALGLPPPVIVSPPAKPGAPWTARSDTADRPERAVVQLDGAGAVLRREDFGQRPWVDRAVGYGVAAHEGQLFGLANQLLGLFTALGLLTLSVSAAVLWWRRRPQGVLGAPEPLARPRFAAGLAALVLLMAVLLPMFGLSLLGVAALERGLLRRLPPAARWLGLRPPRPAPA